MEVISLKQLVLISLILLGILPFVFGVGTDVGLGVEVGVGDITPELFFDPTARVTIDDPAGNNGNITLRAHDYAFTGEQIHWEVLAWDRNGVEDIDTVTLALSDDTSFSSQPVNVSCIENGSRTTNPGDFGARDEAGDYLNFTDTTMAWYDCTYTVTFSDSGEYYIRGEAIDFSGNLGTTNIFETWFFNPELALFISDFSISFDELVPGTRAYSDSLTIGNDALDGSGVLLNMSISGTDFSSTDTSGVLCPTSNVLSLTNFAYYASAGNSNSCSNAGVDGACYDSIPYENGVPSNRATILETPSNILSPGSEVTLTFRLDLPQPCTGDFDLGEISFWAEAV